MNRLALDAHPPLSLVVAALFLVACAPPSELPGPGAAGDAGGTAAPATSEPAVPGDVVDLRLDLPTPVPIDVEGAIASFWWHAPQLKESLRLSDKQVATMDDFARAYLGRWNELMTVRRAGPARVAAALADGDVEAADAAAAAYGDALVQLDAGHQRLKVDVFRLLDLEQRRVLNANHPRLVREPWVVARGLRRPFGQRPR